MIKFICILFLGVALANPILSDKEEWQKFKSQNRRLYQSQDEETHRFQIFKDNLQKVREHNKQYENGETTYKMGINRFSDMTEEEFKAIYGRGVLPRNDEGNKHYEA